MTHPLTTNTKPMTTRVLSQSWCDNIIDQIVQLMNTHTTHTVAVSVVKYLICVILSQVVHVLCSRLVVHLDSSRAQRFCCIGRALKLLHTSSISTEVMGWKVGCVGCLHDIKTSSRNLQNKRFDVQPLSFANFNQRRQTCMSLRIIRQIPCLTSPPAWRNFLVQLAPRNLLFCGTFFNRLAQMLNAMKFLSFTCARSSTQTTSTLNILGQSLWLVTATFLSSSDESPSSIHSIKPGIALSEWSEDSCVN